MSPDEVLQLLRSNAIPTPVAEAALAEMRQRFVQRNDNLSDVIGQLNVHNRQDDYRMDDMIELRDKINDAFDVMREHQEEYDLPDKRAAAMINCEILRAVESAQDKLQHMCDQFYVPKDAHDNDNEQEAIRWQIRGVDSVLFDAHMKVLQAFVGAN